MLNKNNDSEIDKVLEAEKEQDLIQDVIGALNKLLDDHYKFNSRILEEPLGPAHKKRYSVALTVKTT